jgi:protein SCO1/2
MSRCLTCTSVVIVAALAGVACEQGARGERGATAGASPAVEATASPASPGAAATQTYDIRGTVVAVAPDSGTVNLDHEEIPGLMAAMKMEYQVQDAGMLHGLKPGDRVSGRLQARDGDYLIVTLEKQTGR